MSSKAATESFSQQSFSQALWHCNPPSSWDIWVFKVQHILHQVKSGALGNYLFGQFGIFWEYILTQVLDDRTRADYNGRLSAVCRVKRSCVRSIVALVGHCVRSVYCGAVYVATSAVPITTAYTTQLYDCLLYTSPSPRDQRGSRMPSSA